MLNIEGMEIKINNSKEIDQIKNPFKVPENYFAQFNEDIMKHLPEEEKIISNKQVALWDRVKPWVYLAAMFTALYFTINFLKETPDNNNRPNELVVTQQVLSQANNNKMDNYWSSMQITEEEFIQYLEEQLIDDSYFDYMYNQYNLN